MEVAGLITLVQGLLVLVIAGLAWFLVACCAPWRRSRRQSDTLPANHQVQRIKPLRQRQES